MPRPGAQDKDTAASAGDELNRDSIASGEAPARAADAGESEDEDLELFALGRNPNRNRAALMQRRLQHGDSDSEDASSEDSSDD